MTQQSAALIDHPEINSVLKELLSQARSILHDHFVGMYVDGSLAIGDFEPEKSDLDFVVVTDSEVFLTRSKPTAARWAQGALDWRWTPLIQHALVVPRCATRP